jgi:hypothetical protein
LLCGIGTTTQLTGSGTAASTNPWVSSNTSIATVSNTGLVTGGSGGTTVITYTNSNGCSDTASVTVTTCSGYNLTTSSAFNNPDSWTCGVAPSATGGVNISLNTGTTLTLTGPTILGNISFGTGSVINLNGHSLIINGTVSGTGTYQGSSTSDLTIGSSAKSGSLNFASGGQVIHNLTINSNVTLGDSVAIVAGSNPGILTVGSGATLTTNNHLTIKSDANGTASVGTSSGTITGNVTVERYIPQNEYRSWRFLAVPTKGSQSINASWQEGATTAGADPNPGYGTLITSSISNAVASGYDAQTPGCSMLLYKPGVSPTWAGEGAKTKSTPIATTQGWMLYIRGDRTVDTSSSITGSSATTLRTNGSLYQGTIIQNLVSGFNAVSNPYASKIDFTGLTFGASGGGNEFYVWDPLLTGSYGLGGWQTISAINNWQPLPGGGSYTGASNTTIESGMAFLVNTSAASTITFNENAKTGTESGSLGFRPSGAIQSFATNLYAVVNGSNSIADGCMVLFNPAYNSTNDVLKSGNFGESLGITDGTELTAIQASQPVVSTDTIHYSMSGMNNSQYVLGFVPTGMDVSGLTAYLKDSYLKDSTQISLADTSSYTFTSNTSVAGSVASNRFMIIFAQNDISPVPVTFIKVAATQVQQEVNVSWSVATEAGVESYTIERSADGVNFTAIGETAATGAGNYVFEDKSPLAGTGYYRVVSTAVTGGQVYSAIVKVDASGGSSITVYPNPVTDEMTLQFTNQPQGNYKVRLLSAIGQAVFQSEFSYGGGSGAQALLLPNSLAAGMYQLEIITPQGNVITDKVVVK